MVERLHFSLAKHVRWTACPLSMLVQSNPPLHPPVLLAFVHIEGLRLANWEGWALCGAFCEPCLH